MRQYDDVCDDEANNWRICLEKNLGVKPIPKECNVVQESFDKCITTWRSKVGPNVQVKGVNEGEPPIQCAGMSCLVGECLRKFNFEFDRCKPPMDCFKHCVEGFYGKNYVT